MSDMFEDKARDWDERPVPKQISDGIGAYLKDVIEWNSSMRVMDFGAGTGLLASHVAPLVSKVTAVDVSQAMLDQLAAKTDLEEKVETHCQDILQVPLQEELDGIVSAMAMHHVENTDALLATFRAHLKPGGFVALADLDAEDGSFHPPQTEGVFHHGFDRASLEAQLSDAGFGGIRFVTVTTVRKENGAAYPVFLVTAKRQR